MYALFQKTKEEGDLRSKKTGFFQVSKCIPSYISKIVANVNKNGKIIIWTFAAAYLISVNILFKELFMKI
jgi:hypothetical protein